ncbi:MAG: VRR-NUC domain-containing protein [Steroidobacteraceae bacterium]
MNNSKAHSELVNAILLEHGHGDVRIFKNAVGMVERKDGRKFKYGVCNPGGSDLIGWTKVTVTPEMVGTTLAVFTGIEVKTGTGRQSKDQRRFQAAIESAGGRAGVARSVQDAAGFLANKVKAADTP